MITKWETVARRKFKLPKEWTDDRESIKRTVREIKKDNRITLVPLAAVPKSESEIKQDWGRFSAHFVRGEQRCKKTVAYFSVLPGSEMYEKVIQNSQLAVAEISVSVAVEAVREEADAASIAIHCNNAFRKVISGIIGEEEFLDLLTKVEGTEANRTLNKYTKLIENRKKAKAKK